MMRTGYFADLTADLLGALEVGRVERFHPQGQDHLHALKVVPADGGAPVFLRVTRTSGPGGDDFARPEDVPAYEIPADLRGRVDG